MNALDIKDLEETRAESLEDVLDKNDWRLVEILNFRQRIKEAEEKSEQVTVQSIRKSLESFGIEDRVQQAVVLRQFGLNFGEIQAVTELDRNKIYLNVTKHFPKVKKNVDLKIVAYQLKKQGVRKTLRRLYSNVS